MGRHDDARGVPAGGAPDRGGPVRQRCLPMHSLRRPFALDLSPGAARSDMRGFVAPVRALELEDGALAPPDTDGGGWPGGVVHPVPVGDDEVWTLSVGGCAAATVGRAA